MVALCAASAACSATSSPEISLDLSNPKKPAVVLSGLSRADLRALQTAASRAAHVGWTPLFRVSVAPDDAPGALAISGEYTIADGAVRFTPVLPFEGGRPYNATFDPGAAPGGTLAHLPKVTRVLSTPAPPRAPQVHVTAIYPSGPTVPANLLRMYVEFSGPMGTRPAEDYITLFDAQQKEIEGALLPLDTDLWDGDRRRFTILFDPGRVKRGILPNRAMGRPLRAGSSFTIVISPEWPDAQGQPLASEFRKTYRIGPAIERALSSASWKITPPASGSRDPLRIVFPSALDRGLAQRAFTVLRGDREVAGEVRIDESETEWAFVPRDAWQPGDYVISVLPALEDPSGNRLDRPFESLDDRDDTHRPPARVPFQIR